MASSTTISSSSKNGTKENVEPRKGPSECEICYRLAHGHHCGVASCKGCKTFFRRMCVSNSEVTCKLNNDCFDSSKRAQLQLRCQACRYKKCIQVGMDPLALELKEGEDKALNYKKLTGQENEKPKNQPRKVDKVLNNDKIKSRNEETEKDDTKKMAIMTVQSKESQSKSIIDMLIYLDLKCEQFRVSTYNPPITEFQRSLGDLIKCSNKISLTDKYGPIQQWPPVTKSDLPKISRMRNLRDVPAKRIEANSANEKPWMFFTMLTMIEYAKTFMFFHKLDLQDRIILIGHVTLVCMNLHNSYFAVTKKVEGCLHPDGTQQPQQDEYHYQAYSMAIAPLIRCDVQKIEYVLLKAICLCNPTIHGLSDHAQKIIGKERQKYADILLDYCLRNGKNGPSRFVELLGIITVLEIQQRLQKDIHIYYVAPLLEKLGLILRFLDELMNA